MIRRFTFLFFILTLLSFGFSPTEDSITDVVVIKELKVFPNPIATSGKIEFELEKPGNIEVVLLNILGKQVLKITKDYYRSGFIALDFDATELYKGHYFLKITHDEKVQKTIRIYKS
jgi:hypothetical protein